MGSSGAERKLLSTPLPSHSLLDSYFLKSYQVVLSLGKCEGGEVGTELITSLPQRGRVKTLC